MTSLLALTIVQQSATSAFIPEATGTGLEWMTISAVIVPMILLVALLYAGTQSTVR
ncbi:hypothetical protein [Longibacter salinarum]|uniref:hypothetical protein n=1 Tax=Longibacter salinarum TaxID=1850348 RepID=UPI0015CF0D81|nr:hypothetical protein [Longibacter salinarum]